MEFVYVVPRDDLMPTCYPQGIFVQDMGDHLGAMLEHGFFVERGYAEDNPHWKQIIPYCLVVNACGDVLVVQRTKKQGEARLHGKLTMGLGGHINPVDDHPEGALWDNAMRRELNEELEITRPIDVNVRGLVNYDSDPVGAVHFGLIYVARVGTATVRETDNMHGEFMSHADMQRWAESASTSASKFETWSELLLQNLDEVLGVPPF